MTGYVSANLQVEGPIVKAVVRPPAAIIELLAADGIVAVAVG